MFSYCKKSSNLPLEHITNRLKAKRDVRNIAVAIMVISFALAGNATAQPLPVIAISLTDYVFTPNTLSLIGGVSYRLAFTNNETKDHNFSAPGFFAASKIATGDQAKIRDGSIEVGSGQTVEINVTPARIGSYAFMCSHFMHSMMGMHGTITVK
jgi:plastocyanin